MMQGVKHVGRTVTASWQRMVAATGIAVAVWIMFVLLYFPQYSTQMLSYGPTYALEAFSELLWYQYAAGGITGILFPALIAGLVGVAAVATAVSLRQQVQMRESLGGGLGATIGFLSAGCASCSVGVLALLGFAGGVALLPFNGTGLQVASILLLLGSLEYTGRQSSTCEVSP